MQATKNKNAQALPKINKKSIKILKEFAKQGKVIELGSVKLRSLFENSGHPDFPHELVVAGLSEKDWYISRFYLPGDESVDKLGSEVIEGLNVKFLGGEMYIAIDDVLKCVKIMLKNDKEALRNALKLLSHVRLEFYYAINELDDLLSEEDKQLISL